MTARNDDLERERDFWRQLPRRKPPEIVRPGPGQESDPHFREIKDYLAFYPSRMDECRIGEQRVAAQAGDFYGGWITPNIVGPFKGEPGTEGW